MAQLQRVLSQGSRKDSAMARAADFCTDGNKPFDYPRFAVTNSVIMSTKGVTIKQEPIDLEFETDQNEAVMELTSSDHDLQDQVSTWLLLFNIPIPDSIISNCIYYSLVKNDEGMALQITNEQTIRSEKENPEKSTKNEAVRRRTRSFAVPVSPSNLPQDSEKNQGKFGGEACTVEVKDEPIQEDEYDSTLEIESVTGGEILPNPVAVNCPEKERVMEADSTQKSTSTIRTKRRTRRGPHTHVRHKRGFRKKCVYCQINLHSKYSYTKHMQRFHTPVSDSEQKDDKTELKYVIKQKQNSTNSQSSTFQEQIKFTRNNSQESKNKDNGFANDNDKANNSMNNKDSDEEMIEDVEDEIDNMDKNSDTPLSQVQQNIIGQLKTYSCYSCKQVFPDRRTTLNHLRQHLPDLRPFTCVACLTQFPDRAIYKDHCYTSFECAMKIAIVEPKSGLEKYFTCNMCSKSVANRKELLHHLTTQHSEEAMTNAGQTSAKKPAKIGPKQISSPPAIPSLPGPYENGNPAYNHVCGFCGMIYKHERNLREHRELCGRLPANIRTSYACVHCGLTFLVFRKFISHLNTAHHNPEITCSKCRKSFNAAPDYLSHHEKYHLNDPENLHGKDNGRSSSSFESPLKDWNEFEAEVHANESRISRQKYSCALCGQEFPTRTELGEHRNLHLKVKIYSCVICRSMFSSAGALEVHMKDHGIEDPAEQNAHTSCVEYEGTEDTKDNIILTDGPQDSENDPGERDCKICNKSFSSVANQKRHVTNVHRNKKSRRKCIECNKVFSKKNSYEYHMRTEHRRQNSMIKCPVCSQSFNNRANFNLHYENAHANTPRALHECDICGKQFKEELSLKIHRGWHARRTHRLTQDITLLKLNKSVEDVKDPIVKPARARKSFPNSPPAKPVPQLQCQVCDNKFTDVTELRKHLWDVHCSREKSEKDYTSNDLQCELCTHILPDKPSLERHLEWHMENPILSDSKNGLKRKRYYTPRELRTHPCDICGNFYTSRGSLLRHQKLHKVSTVAAAKFQALTKKPLVTQFPCNICHKTFTTSMKLRKHKVRHFVNPNERKRHSVLEKSDYKCDLCLKYYISEVGLRFHLEKTCPFRTDEDGNIQTKRRRIASVGESSASAEIDPPKPIPNLNPLPGVKTNAALPVGWRVKKMVTCSLCQKSFLGKSLFYKHRVTVHQKEIFGRHGMAISKKVNPPPVKAATSATPADGSDFGCRICGKEFPAAMNLKMHMAAVHKNANPNTCRICGASFTTKVGVTNHMAKHSTDSFSCNICQRVFRSRPAVYIHVSRQHPEEYTIMQDDKSKLFTELSTKSSGAEANEPTSFDCAYCNKKFESNKGLRVHAMKRHSVRH